MNELKSVGPGSDFSLKVSNGELIFTNIHIQPRVSFLDYIFGGCEINVHVAIDYTLSNGDPLQDPNSLHAVKQNQGNEYSDAIGSVLQVLHDYNTDSMYSAFGFGGKLPDSPDLNAASHCFALNGDIYRPNCNGVNGVL